MGIVVFNSHHIGYAHVKTNKECEDYSLSYADPQNRFFIAVISDGHSDNNCFRSSTGSRFACERALEVLKSFFETYLDSELSFSDLNDEVKERLKKSIKQGWDDKVEADVADNPLTDEELQPLSDRVRAYYTSGRALENIYGATFLAVAVCRGLCIILHIGDGVVLSITSDGKYIVPIENDPKSETGEPASICDNDLFSRDDAFRCEFFDELPLAVFLTSDGIGDSIDDLNIREFLYTLLSKLDEKKSSANSGKLNDEQQAYLDSCVSYYADENHGVEDDCSIGGFYNDDIEIPKVTIPLDNALALYNEAVSEYMSVISDYERRKKEAIQEVVRLNSAADQARCKDNFNEWFELKKKCEELKCILKNIVNNENNKISVFESKIALCREYVERADGVIDPFSPISCIAVDPQILEEDQEFRVFLDNHKAFKKRKKEEADGLRDEQKNDENGTPEEETNSGNPMVKAEDSEDKEKTINDENTATIAQGKQDSENTKSESGLKKIVDLLFGD